MSKTRREFLVKASAGALAAAVGSATGDAETSAAAKAAKRQTPQTPGAPPAFGTAPAAGPAVTADTFRDAEKLVRVDETEAHLAEMAGNWAQAMAPVYERRTGPRRLALGYDAAPATLWNPLLPGTPAGPVTSDVYFASQSTGSQHAGDPHAEDQDTTPAAHFPANDDVAIAFAPVSVQAAWIQARQLTSERLTRIYLDRLQRFNPKLNCVITLTPEHALAQARAADREIAAGKYRGPLRGIPWGAKDLLDTAGIATTWGAEPFRHRVPTEDATVTRRLNDAGAVLVAKLSLGALALNDIWFGGQTKNPWLLEEGASGSSAGPGAAVAAGLVGFAIGSETQGSIVSPTMRCGITGLRPTFGRVPRTGAMTLSWTCDKLGPMTRGVEDTMMVLAAISGPDLTRGPEAPRGDLACIDRPLRFRSTNSAKGLKVGYFSKWMQEAPATDVDRHALNVVQQLGMTPVEVSLPDWPYSSLNIILFAESAAAFEQITLDHQIDTLRMQVPDAWPNTFRQARFLSAVDLVQADRLRRKVAQEMARVMAEVDLLLVPSLRDEFLVITNFTGHPSLTLRAGFVDVSEARSDWAPDPQHPLPKFSTPRRVPHGITLVGRLFDEGTIVEAGMALESAFNVTAQRPSGF